MKSSILNIIPVSFSMMLLLLNLSCGINKYHLDPKNDSSIITFEKYFGGEYNDSGRSVKETSDGGYIIVGVTTDSLGAYGSDVYLIRTDRSGNLVWENTFGGTSYDFGFSVCETTDSGFIITGATNSNTAGRTDCFLIKANSSGNLVWEKTFGGRLDDAGHSVLEISDGGFILTGRSISSDDFANGVYLVKIDISGHFVWEKTFGGVRGLSVQETADSGFIITGSTNSNTARENDVNLVRTDRNGNLVWEKTFGGTKNNDNGFSVCETSDSGLVVTGYTESSGAGGKDVYLIKTDNNGNLVWDNTYGGTSTDIGFSVCETFDFGFIITGYTQSSGAGGKDVYLIKTDNSGNLVWEKTFGGSDYDIGYSVCETTDSGFIITGSTISNTAGGSSLYLIKTDSEGNVY